MSRRDGHSSEEQKSELEKNYNVEILDFGENNVGAPTTQATSRMEEAIARLIHIMPILCAANRRGVVHLKSYSDPRGIRLDAKSNSYEEMVSKTTAFLSGLRPDMDHTPSVTSYFESCQEAVASMRSGETQTATIIEATDGEPNQRIKPEFERIYKEYTQTVLHRNLDYTREDGSVIPNHEARTWDMDRDTPPLMRRLSVLAGHYALPTTFAACTDNQYEIGELNEIDQIHNTVATLDDFKNEQKEVLKAQGPRIPFNLATYMALYFIAPKEHFLDQLDENPLTPDKLERYLGYYPGNDAYLENLECTETAVLASAEANGVHVPIATATPIPSAPPAQFFASPSPYAPDGYTNKY